MPNQPIKKDKAKNWLAKHYKLLAVLIAVLILGLGYFYLLGPKYQELKSGGRSNLKSRQLDLAILEQQLAKLKVLRQDLADLENQDLNILSSVLPAKPDWPGLLVQLAEIAAENSFTLLSVNIRPLASPAKETVSFGPKKLNLGLALAGGNYADLLRLLDAFEYNLRLMDVASINFVPNPAGTAYSINLVTYYLAD